MQHPPKEAPTYAIVLPIDTNRGAGRTLRMGPTRVSFVTASSFQPGDTLRFAMSLRGMGAMSLQIFCSGSVSNVTIDGDLFVVEASIEQTQIASGE